MAACHTTSREKKEKLIPPHSLLTLEKISIVVNLVGQWIFAHFLVILKLDCTLKFIKC